MNHPLTHTKKLGSLGLLLVAAVFAHTSAHAETIYRQIDSNGNVTFTNIPMHGATPYKVTAPRPSVAPKASSNNAPRAVASNPTRSPSSSNYPKVSNREQNVRDNQRRQILLNELQAETNKVTQLQAELARTTQPDAQTKLRSAIKEAGYNVTALESELARL